MSAAGSSEVVSIRILDREYTVGVEPGEQDSLRSAARLLDNRMRDVRGANRMAAVDRVAVLAALNLAHELQQLREQTERREHELARTLGELQRKLDALLDA
ncbi:cell division protein ZapA [Luteimonas aquatica]|uniref:cell division protein ZapA n=1 Tax=Luteimonas aquatica TaxID=450364 RepID=UPI001F56F49D|nr:cell division protein ZapA [Luteimonas aquatica]